MNKNFIEVHAVCGKNIILSKVITFGLILILFLAVPAAPRVADAGTVTIDVCQTVLKQVLIPATYQDVVTCNNEWYICAFVDPACCIPGVCNTLPHCMITQQVCTAAAHLEDQLVVECHPENFDPAVEWKKWLQQSIPSLDDLLLPGAFEAAKLDIQAMKAASTAIPAKVKVQVLGLLQAIPAAQSKVTVNEVNNSRLIANTNINASLYLRDGFDAITLYDLIVIRNNHYQVLMNTQNHNYTVDQIKNGVAPAEYVDALLLLIHELVHVRQYAGLGFDAFLTNYLIETICKGYGKDSFEAEAYGFESTVASTTSGLQAVEVEQAQAVAEVLGGCPKLVLQNKMLWANVSKSFSNCIAGKESMDAAGRGAKIKKQDCAAAITAKYNLAGSFAICEPTIPTLGGGKIIKRPGDGRRIKVTPETEISQTFQKVRTAQGKVITVKTTGMNKAPTGIKQQGITTIQGAQTRGVTVQPQGVKGGIQQQQQSFR